MHLDPRFSLAGLIVGFLVGLTGMGGGALMTPLLILVFGVQPLAAVSSDLVASLVMKPLGALVHVRRRTVHWPLVGWLCLGSVPSAFLGVVVLRLVGHGAATQQAIKVLLGTVLLLALAAMVVRTVITRLELGVPEPPGHLAVRPLATTAIGALAGLAVGLTSVGSGSLVIALLLLRYPRLRAAQLVGTDLAQAIPLVGAAALGHLLFGDVRLPITLSLVAGALPGIYAGARLSAQGPGQVVRPVLLVVLLASALKLVQLSTAAVLWASGGAALAAAVGHAVLVRRTQPGY